MNGVSQKSKFSNERGILFAADLPTERELWKCLTEVAPHINAIKLGNALLYTQGYELCSKVKKDFSLPVFVDIKLTDVSHIATRVVDGFACAGADVVITSGICGSEVMRDLVRAADKRLEIWAFTEFTNDSGLIDETLADRTVKSIKDVGVMGFQAPGTRPHRVEDVRDIIGDQLGITACGIGTQGGRFGGAIEAGANLEIVGRAIYMQNDRASAAKEVKNSLLGVT